MPKLVQRDDILRFCDRRGITLQAFGDYVVACMATGIPHHEAGFYGRCWQIVQDLLAEGDALKLARYYTAADTCPYCGAEPVPTGGREPHWACNTCEAWIVDVQKRDGVTYYRWSEPARAVPQLVQLPFAMAANSADSTFIESYN